jgi:hypothetical protein
LIPLFVILTIRPGWLNETAAVGAASLSTSNEAKSSTMTLLMVLRMLTKRWCRLSRSYVALGLLLQ